MEELIKLDAYPIRGLVRRLLQDKTTRKNIMFASDSYTDYGAGYRDNSQMTEGVLLGFDSCDIQPRVYKAAAEQTERTRKRAEVFTPAWIVNQMNNHCDAEWFGHLDVFNKQDEQSWEINTEPILFPEGKDWKQYVDSFQITLTTPSGSQIVVSEETAGTFRSLQDGMEILWYFGEPSPYQILQEIYLEIIPAYDRTMIQGGIWKLTLTPKQLVDGRFDLWMPSGVQINEETGFLVSESALTLTIPSTARRPSCSTTRCSTPSRRSLKTASTFPRRHASSTSTATRWSTGWAWSAPSSRWRRPWVCSRA